LSYADVGKKNTVTYVLQLFFSVFGSLLGLLCLDRHLVHFL
jgi:hypothetical protein